jgi:hypothetical protein
MSCICNVLHRRPGADSDKIPEGGTSTYILHLCGLNYGLTYTGYRNESCQYYCYFFTENISHAVLVQYFHHSFILKKYRYNVKRKMCEFYGQPFLHLNQKLNMKR